jgi:murein DD-endopeptidase MepM/ murein hydrolase activator NlpD
MKKVLVFSLAIILIISVYLFISPYFLDRVYFLCPIEYESNIVIRNDTRGDGYFAASRRGRRIHNGIDLLAELYTPVLASRSGRVIAAQSNHGMGNYIKIQHRGNIVTIYGHLSEMFVKRNQFVRQGQIIGSVGKTGNANSPAVLPHLHFEVRKDGVPQDPSEYLEQGKGH